MLQSRTSHASIVLTSEQLAAATQEEGALRRSVNGTTSATGDKQTVDDVKASHAVTVWKFACLMIGSAAIVSVVACLRRHIESCDEDCCQFDLDGLPAATANSKRSSPVGPQWGVPIPAATAEGGILPLLEQNARNQPDATALVDAEGGEIVSYAELLKQSRALANHLRKADLGNGDVVGLLLEPSRHFVVATLACMQVGACWLPLDLKSPGMRLSSLLDRAGARLALVADGCSLAPVVPVPVWVFRIGGEVESGGGQPPPPRPVLPHVERASGTAAIFYTSGSTGEPKAVRYGPDTICHGALCAARLCEADSESIFLVKTPVVWAVTEYEVFTPLAVGAKAVVDARAQRDVVRLAQTIGRHDVSVLVTSAPVLQLLADERLPSLEHVVNVGAALPLEVCALLHRSFGASLSIHNLYGCTETPCIQWTYDPSLPPRGGKLALAGLPQPGVEVQLLDGDLHPVHEGAVGEIYIGGPFLSLGYLGDEQLTQERFAVVAPGGLFYKTGDAGRWLREANGGLALQVEGRVDRQLNIKGVRVAPEEVEAVLCQAPGVREASLVVIGEPGAERMVACVAGTGEGVLREAVDAHGSEHLPMHMRPAVVLVISSLPKLANGKVDLVSLRHRVTKEVPPPEEDAVSAVDSLGQMKTIKRQALLENRAMSAMRALAAIQIVLYHWYWTVFADYSIWVFKNKALWEKQGHPLLQDAITGFVGISCWSMHLFVTLQGYVDSREAPTSMIQQNLLAIVLYFMAYWPLPQLFGYIIRGPLQNEAFWINFWNGSHRWYMVYYVVCNCLHLFVFLPLRSRLTGASTRSVVLMRVVVLACVGLPIWLLKSFERVFQLPPFNSCPREMSKWSFSVMKFFFLDFAPGFCTLIRRQFLELFFMYSVAWWLGPPIIDYLHKAQWAGAVFSIGPMPWLVVLFAGLTVYGRGMPHCTSDWPNQCDWFMSLADPVFGYLVILTIALASGCRWFPTSFLSWLGNSSLAVYVIHVYFGVSLESGEDLGMQFFTYNGTVIIPTPQHAMAVVGNWAGCSVLKLTILLAYPVLFSATVGVAFQKMILLGIVSCQKAVKELTRC